MSYRIFILFLSFSQCVCKNTINVKTFLQYSANDNSTVTVICQTDVVQSQEIGAKLYSGKDKVCEMLEKSEECECLANGTEFRFTLKNLNEDQKKQIYFCLMYTMNPPVIRQKGQEFVPIPGCNIKPTSPKYSCEIDQEESFSIFSPLTLTLGGIIILLCGYSVIVTVFCFRLRQCRVKSKRKIKGNDNTEYMDMRKVQQQAGPIRDLNYNSHGINGKVAL